MNASAKPILVIGGGIAGITAAVDAAEVGYRVILVEKEAYLGGRVLRSFRRVIVPELNMGQLAMLVRARFLVDARPFNKVQGLPFTSQELSDRILEAVEEVSR